MENSITNKDNKTTFGDKGYLKGPRFLSYFTLIVLLCLFCIYSVEQLIDPNGTFFIQIALMVTGMYVVSFTYRMKQVLMF